MVAVGGHYCLELLLLVQEVVIELGVAQVLCSLSAYKLVLLILLSSFGPFQSAVSSPLCRQLIIDPHHSYVLLLLLNFDAAILVGGVEVVQVLLVLVLTHHRSRLPAFNFLWNLDSIVSNLGYLLIGSEVGVLLIVVEGRVVEATLLADLAGVLGGQFACVSSQGRAVVSDLAQILPQLRTLL